MKTRLSPRNQERLWKELGKTNAATKVKPAPLTDEEIDGMFWMRRSERERLKAARK